MGKKNPFVFTIGFDKKNPEHQEVVEILNQTDKKAALIADAILQYTGKKSIEDVGISQERLQSMVQLLIKQEMARLELSSQAPQGAGLKTTAPVSLPDFAEEVQDLNESGPPIDEGTIQDIADAMAAFRNM